MKVLLKDDCIAEASACASVYTIDPVSTYYLLDLFPHELSPHAVGSFLERSHMCRCCCSL